jgi:hypothetical protein
MRAMLYELWETKSHNRIGAFPSPEAAIELVRRAVERHGSGYTDTLVLAREDDEGDTELIAEGADLAKLAAAPLAV